MKKPIHLLVAVIMLFLCDLSILTNACPPPDCDPCHEGDWCTWACDTGEVCCEEGNGGDGECCEDDSFCCNDACQECCKDYLSTDDPVHCSEDYPFCENYVCVECLTGGDCIGECHDGCVSNSCWDNNSLCTGECHGDCIDGECEDLDSLCNGCQHCTNGICVWDCDQAYCCETPGEEVKCQECCFDIQCEELGDVGDECLEDRKCCPLMRICGTEQDKICCEEGSECCGEVCCDVGVHCCRDQCGYCDNNFPKYYCCNDQCCGNGDYCDSYCQYNSAFEIFECIPCCNPEGGSQCDPGTNPFTVGCPMDPSPESHQCGIGIEGKVCAWDTTSNGNGLNAAFYSECSNCPSLEQTWCSAYTPTLLCENATKWMPLPEIMCVCEDTDLGLVNPVQNGTKYICPGS